MYKTSPVPVPTDCTRIVRCKGSNGETYVSYTTAYNYDPKTQSNHPTRKAIGKLVPGDSSMMYPNENYYEIFQDAVKPQTLETGRSRSLKAGAFFVFMKLIAESGLDAIMSRVLGYDAGFGLDLALYSAIEKSNAMQHYTDYAKSHPLFTKKQKMYSDSTVSTFFNRIGTEGRDILFLDEWAKGRAKDGPVYISYDSTNKEFETGDLIITESGKHARKADGIGNGTILSIGFDLTAREPVFYELNYSAYAGTNSGMDSGADSGTTAGVSACASEVSVDVPAGVAAGASAGVSSDVPFTSELEDAVEQAHARGFANAGFVFDRGNLSRTDIEYMDRNDIPYMLVAQGRQPWIKDLILANAWTFERDYTHRIPEESVNGMTVYAQLPQVTDTMKYCHLFYSLDLAIKELHSLDDDLMTLGDELAAAKKQGVFDGDVKRYSKYFDLDISRDNEGRNVLAGYTIKQEEVDGMYRIAGYFAIVTSEKMDARDALFKYRYIAETEKLFRGDNSFAPGGRVASDESLLGKLMIEFLALVLHSMFVSRLEDAKDESACWHEYPTADLAMQELEKITMTAGPDKIFLLDKVPTKKQKTVLAAFGIVPDEIRRYGEAVSKILTGKQQGDLLLLCEKWFRKKPKKEGIGTEQE